MGQMMTLVGYKVKTGKHGSPARHGKSAKVSRLCKFKLMGYSVWAMQPNQPKTLRDLYPNLTDQQLEEAEANLERYLAVMMRIAARLQAEGYCLTDPDLTVPGPLPTIHDERSNLPEKNH
jgi:hypothetical protein